MLLLRLLLELQNERKPEGIDKTILRKISQAGEVNIEEDSTRVSARR